MKIIPIANQAYRVQAPLSAIRRIALDPAHFPLSTSDPRLDDAVLLATHAKAYYQGGGWWYLIGYASNGEDVSRLISVLTDHCSQEDFSAHIRREVRRLTGRL